MRIGTNQAPWLVLAASLLFTAAATSFVGWSAHLRDEARFENAVQASFDRITGRLGVYLATLRGGAALFAASDTVTQRNFREFVERLHLQERYPGIQGMGWSQRVEAGLSGDADERHAIRYLEPMDARNRAAIGFDMYSEPTRRQAMRRARDEAEPALSGKVTLVQEIYGRKQAGFLIYLPVYRGGDVPATLEERRERLLGFVYSPFRADDLFAGLFGTEEQPRVSLHVYDGFSTEADALLHASGGTPSHDPQYTAVRTLRVAGHPWTVTFVSEPSFEAASGQYLIPVVLLTGLVVSGLLFWLARSQARARLAAETANRAKAEFLSTMSHELRTPLNAITGYVDLLAMEIRGPINDAQREDLRRIKRAQEHLLTLINDVLNFAKLEAGRLELERERVALSQIVADLVPMVEPQVRAKQQHFHAEAIDPKLRVWGDPDRIRQILLNLLSNAVKFTPSGGRITVETHRKGDRAVVQVTDTGRGIPTEKLKSIFDPFVQVDRRSLEESQQGVGLGLAISRELAHAMDGDLTARSEPGAGSTFCLYLPLVKGEE